MAFFTAKIDPISKESGDKSLLGLLGEKLEQVNAIFKESYDCLLAFVLTVKLCDPHSTSVGPTDLVTLDLVPDFYAHRFLCFSFYFFHSGFNCWSRAAI